MTSERGIDSENQETLDNLEDTEEIKCICDNPDDDGYTIQCDYCYTWQHVGCMRVDPEVEDYKCHICSSRKIEKLLMDGKKSRKHQKVRRETESGTYPSHSVSQMDELSTTGMPNTKSRNKSDLSFTAKERQSSSYSKDYETIDKNVIASKAVEELFPKIYSQYQQRQAQHRKRSMSLSSTSKTENEHIRDDNQESSSIRSMSPTLEIGNPFMMEKESLARPLMKTIVKHINQSRPKMLKKHLNCYGLFAETNISTGRFIVEFKGEICFKSDYKANESNQYSLLGVTQPFVLFYPVLNLCVDARRVGTEARFIRRSCHPNAESRTIVVPGGDDQQVHLGIFAKSEILKGREITIGWDWESNHIVDILMQDSNFENDDYENFIANKRDEIGKIATAILRLTECACENKDDCIIYKMQNEGKILSKSRKKKLAMNIEEMSIEGEKESSPGINDDDYEEDTDILIASGNVQKKRDNVGLMRKANRKVKSIVEKLNEIPLNGNNKISLEENEVSGQIIRKEKKKSKEIDTITKSDNIAQPSQKTKGKSVNRIVREEPSGNIKRKSLSSRKTEKSTGNKHSRSSSVSKTGSSKRILQHGDDEEHSDSSLSSSLTNSEMSIDEDPSVSIIEVNPPDRNNVDKNNSNEPTKDSNEDQLPENSIETMGISDISQSKTILPRPLPPAISGIPFKDYLILMHEWKKAVEAASTSASAGNYSNSSLPTIHESNVETTSEYAELGNSKSNGSKNHSNEIEMDLFMDKDYTDQDEGLVPLSTPIIPAKRMAVSPSPTPNNQNGTTLYGESGSDVKGKRQKIEDFNSTKGKGKEEKEQSVKSLQDIMTLTLENNDNVEGTTINSSGDLKKQVIDSSTSNNNEGSKASSSMPKKVTLDEYRSQILNKETCEKKSTTDSKPSISPATENDNKDNQPIDNNDTFSTKDDVKFSVKTKPSYQDQKRLGLAESSNNISVDILKKSTEQVLSNSIEEHKQNSGVIENKPINEQTKSEEVMNSTVSVSPKSPKTSNMPIEDNHTASQSSMINDGYFPEVDLPFDFSTSALDTSKDIEYGRHTNSSHSDGSYEEIRGRHSPSYKDYSPVKSSSNYNPSFNSLPLGDNSIQTSPRTMSPPRAPRFNGGRGNRMPYRSISVSPGERRYGGYYNSSTSSATPRGGAQSSMMSSPLSSPYDPANPDGQSANISNERDSALDNSNVGNNTGSGITMEPKTRDYARISGDREWRERDRDDGRKDWNNKRSDHYRDREYTNYSMMATRRPSSGPHQDRYMIGSVPTGPAAGPNHSPSSISKNNDPSSSSNNSSQRFVDDHRRNRR
ncbi:13463_t:CDS:2 [Funneliformis geosporum]|uniref:13463_t:CDS:1 n=1 Tax=Funneliformis geosporum TaxID=1117311 RepID=A0A9W4SSG9_9GLOM|nr:13463_t:CDS:2 [Funneliformis geosporum]